MWLPGSRQGKEEAGGRRLRRELGRVGPGQIAACHRDGGRFGHRRKEGVGWTSGQEWGLRAIRRGESSVAWIWDPGFLAALVPTAVGALVGSESCPRWERRHRVSWHRGGLWRVQTCVLGIPLLGGHWGG